ncbi:hypothetical protein ACFLXL_00030 [Chloroflexota bacterium]
MDFEKEKKAIWHEFEKQHGLRVPQKGKDYLEREMVGDSERNFAGDPEGENEYLRTLRNVAESYITVIKLFFEEKPSYDNSGKLSKPKKTYRKCFERRFYLVDFIVDKGWNIKTGRINWKGTVNEWNKAHPSDIMSLPVLKAEYYRAMQEAPLIIQYLLTVMVEKAEFYRQSFQDGNYILDWERPKGCSTLTEKELKEFYGKFKKITSVYFKTMKAHGPHNFLTESFGRLIDIIESIQEIRERQLLERKKQLEEA